MQNRLLCRTKPENKESVEKLIKKSQPLLKLLKQCIEEDLAQTDKFIETDLDCPSFAVKMAYREGLKKGLTKLLEYVIINA